MVNRKQVQFDPPEPTLQPVATPQSVGYAPRIPKAQLLPIKELAGLSETLTQISLQQAEKDNEAEREAGRKAGIDAGQDTIDQLAQAHKDLSAAEYEQKVNQVAFRRAEGDGSIEKAQNPWRKVGFIESSAQRIMAQYHSELIANMQKATATVDKDGMPAAAQPAESVIAETWDKYKGNPFLSDYYGSKIATAQKLAVDAQFQQEASRRLADEQSKAYQQNANNSVGQWAITQSLKKSLDPETVTNFDAVMGDIRLKGGDPRVALKEGLGLMASNSASADDGSGPTSVAADDLRRMMSLRVGTTTIKNDAELGPYFQQEIERLDADHVRKASLKLAGTQAQRNLAFDRADHEALQAIDAARKAGETTDGVTAIVDKLIGQVRDGKTYGEDSLEVAQHLVAFRNGLATEDNAQNRTQILEDLNRRGDAAGARYAAQVALDDKRISYDDFKAVTAEITAHENVAPILHGESVIGSDKRVAQYTKIEGVPEGAGVGLGRNLGDRQQAFEEERSAYARSNAELPPEQQREKMDAWIKTNEPKLKQDAQSAKDLFNKERLEKRLAANDALARFQPVPEGTVDGEHFSQDEIVRYNEASTRAASKENFFESSTYKEALSERIQNAFAAVDKSSLEPADQGALRSAIQIRFREDALSSLQAVMETAKPGEVAQKWSENLLDVGVKFDQRNIASNFSTYSELLRPKAEGEAKTTIQEGQALIEKNAANVTAAATLKALPSGDAYAKALVATRDPNVGADAYDVLTSAIAGTRRGVFGILPGNTLVDARTRASAEAGKVLANPSLNDATKKSAVMSLVAPIGIPAEDALAGKVVLRQPPEQRAALEALLATYKNPAYITVGTDPFGRAVAQTRKYLEDQLAAVPPELPLAAGDFNPHTTLMFQSQDELQSWIKDGRARQLASKYGVGGQAADFKLWLANQTDLIDRRTRAR